MDRFVEKTYGLAGIFQAATLVQQIARTGGTERFAHNASINSVLILDAVNTPAIFSDKQGIELGFKQILEVFDQPRSMERIEIFQYVAGLSQLSINLQRDQERLTGFSNMVESLSAFSGDQLIERMAETYKQYISDLQPRILVNGEQGLLAQDEIAQQVRAYLLAGIRSAFLWQQKGGSRWDFMLKRKKYVQVASDML